MTDPEAAADAFGVLSDASRFAILRELAAGFYGQGGQPIGFAELRRTVGIEDPGRFNYHLNELRDRFVVKRDGGYAPTVAGLKAVESATAGIFTDDADAVSDTVDHNCSECGDPLTVTYENHWVSVACDDHGLRFRTIVGSSIDADADLEAVVRYAAGETWRRIDRATDGVCPICRSRGLSLDFRETEAGVLADCTCGECYYEETNHAGLFALSHPAVVSLFHDHGIDVRERLPFGSLPDLGADVRFGDDGRAVEVTATAGDDAVTLRVHEDLTVEAL